MAQKSKPKGEGVTEVYEDTPVALTETQTLTLPWPLTRWTFGVRFYDTNGDLVAEGAFPTTGTLTFRIKTHVSQRWEVFSSNAVDLSTADGGYSATAAAHLVGVEMVPSGPISGGDAVTCALYATGSGEGRV